MYTKGFDIQDVAKFRQWIAETRNVLLVSHMNADGDACGSLLGMTLMLDCAKGDKGLVTPVLPNGCPKNFTWLPGADRIVSGEKDRALWQERLKEADMIICLDLNAASRTDMLAEELSQARCRKVLIDHHHSPDKEHFDLIFSDYAISSTCELVLWLSYAMWDERFMNREVATCLYAGLNTDTGGFAFSCEQPSCFEAAAKLVKFDIHPAEIHNKIVNTFSVNRMQFYGFALNERLKIYPSQHVAIMVFSLDDQRRFGVGGEDMEGLVNYTLMMKEMEVGALLREESGRTKVSLRAKYDVDVNMIARQLGGGGHTKAAGATCIMPLDKTLDAVEQLLGIKNVEPLIIGAER